MVYEWKVICNPKSANGKADRDWPHIKSLLEHHNIQFHCSFSRHKYHAIELASQAYEKGFRHFIIIGGDGSLHEVVNGIARFNEHALDHTEFALIPVGKGNDWARTYGIPKNYRKAITIIARHHTTRQDLGHITYHTADGSSDSRYFINMAGVGFDAYVADAIGERFERGGKLSAISYTWQLVRSLFTYRSKEAAVTVDNSSTRIQLFTLAAGIGRYNGGGMQQCPHANTNDALLDITEVHHVSIPTVILNIHRLFSGTFVKKRQVKQYRSNQLKITSAANLLAETDGELLGWLPAEIKITGKKVQIVIP